MSKPLWEPSEARRKSARITSFMAAVNEKHGAGANDYEALWRWSIEQEELFWDAVWDFCGVIGDKGARAVADKDKLPGAKFFPDGSLNFAENLLRLRNDSEAMVFWGEDKVKRSLSWNEVYDTTSRFWQALRDMGISPGDRVAGFMPNMPETMMFMMGATSLGATVSTASPDFGIQGVLDRFGQIDPKVLISTDGYFFNGKVHSSLKKLPEILAGLPTVEKVVIVPYTEDAPDISGIPNAVLLEDFLADYKPADIEFTRVNFNHPLYILFSSGTTGVPKCIVHGTGGVLLTHLREHALLNDIRPGDRVFYYTTCGWMMWNWLATVLASEATIILYDGSPFYPDGNVMFDLADATGTTLFGTSAKFIDAVNKAGLEPIKTHKLDTVRTICSTGSTLVPEGFDFVYESIKKDVHLASMSGGTDLCGCFVGGQPLGAVWRGELQARSLGMAVDVFDENGRHVEGQKGELVCTNAFPSMPLQFWNDPGDERYKAAYFERFPNVWTHGDFVRVTDHHGMIIYGRSDATLNSGGVRIGTAEIYRQVEKLPEIAESIVIGQDWDDDTRIVLFVRMQEGQSLTDEVLAKLKKTIREGASPRHVPAKTIQVSDIPRTKSGKIVELAVRNVVHGEPVKNKEALANPEALDLFKALPELST